MDTKHVDQTVYVLENLQDVVNARDGDKAAFIRLIHGVENCLYQTARAIVKTDEDCADAIQETILKAYRSLSSLREPAYFKTWIIRILINECRKILKAKNRVKPVSHMNEKGGLESGYARTEVVQILEQLQEDLRLVVRLYYFIEMPIREIAAVLNVPEGTVKSRLHRARTELLQYMGSWDSLGKGVK